MKNRSAEFIAMIVEEVNKLMREGFSSAKRYLSDTLHNIQETGWKLLTDIGNLAVGDLMMRVETYLITKFNKLSDFISASSSAGMGLVKFAKMIGLHALAEKGIHLTCKATEKALVLLIETFIRKTFSSEDVDGKIEHEDVKSSRVFDKEDIGVYFIQIEQKSKIDNSESIEVSFVEC